MLTETNFTMLKKLDNYMPADKHFTSEKEVEHITKTLHLDEMNKIELQNIRDMAVLLYDQKKDNTGDKEEMWNISNAMMSVTAVIDQHIYACI